MIVRASTRAGCLRHVVRNLLGGRVREAEPARVSGGAGQSLISLAYGALIR